jgi:hypothetical protein
MPIIVEHHNTSEIVCPYCGHEHENSAEYRTGQDEFSLVCESCNKIFWVSRIKHTEYSTECYLVPGTVEKATPEATPEATLEAAPKCGDVVPVQQVIRLSEAVPGVYTICRTTRPIKQWQVIVEDTGECIADSLASEDAAYAWLRTMCGSGDLYGYLVQPEMEGDPCTN